MLSVLRIATYWIIVNIFNMLWFLQYISSTDVNKEFGNVGNLSVLTCFLLLLVTCFLFPCLYLNFLLTSLSFSSLSTITLWPTISSKLFNPRLFLMPQIRIPPTIVCDCKIYLFTYYLWNVMLVCYRSLRKETTIFVVDTLLSAEVSASSNFSLQSSMWMVGFDWHSITSTSVV